ncbi:acyl-CoA N-acyltransferase [Collybia nuda]|uniref:N-alpha-acetyltransferase 60 n=1 Tax=Collybia nuda TaxID=64659 RepID=A0A9P6CP67_9AGAR|nr:acyl-CoA N-acyltransferase [Collybia nuda]
MFPSSTLGGIVIRPLTSTDVPKVRELHSMVLPVAYPSSFFTQLLLLPARVCLVAHESSSPGEPVAFISASIRDAHPVANYFTIQNTHRRQSGVCSATTQQRPHIEILTLGVLPHHQNKGIARLLVRRVHQHFCEYLGHSQNFDQGAVVHANVATSNRTALTFYERIGMQVSSDVIRNLYRTCSHGSRDGYLVVGILDRLGQYK